MGDYLGLAFVALGICNLIALPWLVLYRIGKIQDKVEYLQASIDVLDESLFPEEDDPDPADEANEANESRPSSVIAFGRVA